MVAAPTSIEEASWLLAGLEPDQPVRIVGEGTNQEPVVPGSLELRTAGLDWIDARVDDLTVAVGAGVRLSELNAVLAEARLRIALDPVADGTVGAMVATSAHGAMVWRYGGVRDLVIGATLVLADGTVAHSGGHVIKNVAGYDLAKLVCGARGRIALVGEVVLRAHPRPQAERGVLVASGPAELRTLLEVALAERVEPVAIDWLAAPAEALVVFEGTERGVEAQSARLERALRAHGIAATELDAARLDAERTARAAFRVPRDGVVLRLAGRASRMLAWLERTTAPPGISLASYPGAGLVDVVADPGGAGALPALLDDARREGAVGEVRRAEGVDDAVGFGLVDRFAHPLVARLADELDPERRFR